MPGTDHYSTAPQSSVNGIAARIILEDAEGPISPSNPLNVAPAASPTGTTTVVPDLATVTTLLAANAARRGATIYNDSSAVLRLKLGSAAAADSFTMILAGNGSGIGGYYEVPFGYTGIITGIWASDAGGDAKVTEIV